MGTGTKVTRSGRREIRRRLGSWLRPTRELERARRAADAELKQLELPPPRLAWRSAELTAGAHRLQLARELRKLVEAADGRYLPGASPIDRVEIRKEADLLHALATRLDALSQPVGPRGVLLLEHILHDSESPLYQGFAVDTLRQALSEAAEALEPRR